MPDPKTNESLKLTNEQLRLNNEQLFEAKYESVYGHQLDLWQLAVQTPDVAPYIVGGQEPKGSGPERARIDAALANSLDFYAYVFAQLAPRYEDGDLPSNVLTVLPDQATPDGIDPDAWEQWRSWAPTIVHGFTMAPGMCDNLGTEDPSGGLVYDIGFIRAVRDAGAC